MEEQKETVISLCSTCCGAGSIPKFGRLGDNFIVVQCPTCEGKGSIEGNYIEFKKSFSFSFKAWHEDPDREIPEEVIKFIFCHAPWLSLPQLTLTSKEVADLLIKFYDFLAAQWV